MDTGIGTTLRDARNRRRLELSEVERATKIRPRFLLAMESEDWDDLPGGAYTRSFIRTYASYLGLDGERLAEDYRRMAGEPAPGERGAPRADPVVAGASPRRGGKLPRRALGALVTAVVIGTLVVLGLTGGDSGEPSGRYSGTQAERGVPGAERDAERAAGLKGGVSVRLAANAAVWVCLLGADGEELVDGQVLDAGAEEGPFRSGSFTVSFGNGEISMWIDGQQVAIEETSSPVGYEIDEDGGLSPLAEAERPTCT